MNSGTTSFGTVYKIRSYALALGAKKGSVGAGLGLAGWRLLEHIDIEVVDRYNQSRRYKPNAT